MGYRHPYNYNNGSSSASTYYYGGAASHAFCASQPAGPSQQRDVIDYLPDEAGAPRRQAVVPGSNAFDTPWRMPVGQQVVPDATVYGHASSSGIAAAAAVPTTTTTGANRIAFRMRSDEEVLDDGYKWRKYGKKSVKNSPNPRNYYRCSTEGCNVKKRVERDRDDPSYVVTMYEGVHNHVSPDTIYYATQDAASGRFFVSGMQHHPGP